MKDIFVSNTGRILIENKNFSLVDTSSIMSSIINYSFIKENTGEIYIANFTDADTIDFNRLQQSREICLEEMSIFKKAISGGMLIYYKVFVTEKGLPGDVINDILSWGSRSMVTKAAFFPLIIDLTSKTVLYNSKDKIDRVGLIDTLEDSVEGLNNFTSYYDLEKLQSMTESETTPVNIKSLRTFKPYITYMIILINILMFIVMTASGGTTNTSVLIRFGAKVNSLILNGQYWRLITSAFIHIGYAHLLFNMYGLYCIGPIVENIYGGWKYMSIYIVSALCGSILSLLFSPYLSAGASGAIFGLLGALLYLGRKRPGLFSTSFGINILVVIGFNLIYGFTNSGIDNFAHIGGLIGGYIASNIAGINLDK